LHQVHDERRIICGIALPVQQVARLFRTFVRLEVRDSCCEAHVVEISGVMQHLAVDEILGEEQDVAHSLAIAVARQFAQKNCGTALQVWAGLEVAQGREHGQAVLFV
jgi:hypothetical protein